MFITNKLRRNSMLRIILLVLRKIMNRLFHPISGHYNLSSFWLLTSYINHKIFMHRKSPFLWPLYLTENFQLFLPGSTLPGLKPGWKGNLTHENEDKSRRKWIVVVDTRLEGRIYTSWNCVKCRTVRSGLILFRLTSSSGKYYHLSFDHIFLFTTHLPKKTF